MSTATMGYHEPYSFVAQLVTREPQRDPDLMLLSKLDTGVTYFGRIRVWCGSTVWDQTSEFTFTLEPDEPEPTIGHFANLDWIADDENTGWSTFFIITNTGLTTAQVDVFFYYAFTGGLNIIGHHEIASRACAIVDTNADESLWNRYLNALVRSTEPFSVLVYSIHESGMSFQYRVDSVKK